MTISGLVQQEDTRSLPVLEIVPWCEALSLSLRAGLRVVTLYGRRTGDEVWIRAVLSDGDGPLHVLQTCVLASLGYHSLTPEFPALLVFEQELHEQTAVRIKGNPWLKPLRYEGREPVAMRAHPFYEIEGKEVHQVAVGPIHAGVIEPGAFRFLCHGEQVLHLEHQLGYQHRGVERLLCEGDPLRLTPLVETIAGDSSIAHAWAHCAALEALAGLAPQRVIEVARGVALELERIALHLATLSGLSADLGFVQVASSYGRLRTLVINTLMELCGSRFGRGALRPGGIALRALPDLYVRTDRLREELALTNACFMGARSVQHRLRATGVLSRAQALALGTVGVIARASGIACDLRELGQGVYRLLPIEPAIESDGDCWARARVRIEEMDASLDWLSTVLALFPDWSCARATLGALAPSQWVISRVEGARGEVVHCLETGSAGELLHYRVQDPSLRNWMGLAIAMRGNAISDFPICNKSFDLSYCGHDL